MKSLRRIQHLEHVIPESVGAHPLILSKEPFSQEHCSSREGQNVMNMLRTYLRLEFTQLLNILDLFYKHVYGIERNLVYDVIICN